MREGLIRAAAVMLGFLAAAGSASAQGSERTNIAASNVLQAAADDYANCVLEGIRSGTKVDLDDAVIGSALQKCASVYNRLEAAAEGMVPVEERKLYRDRFQSVHKMMKKQAVLMAVSAYLNQHAGGESRSNREETK